LYFPWVLSVRAIDWSKKEVRKCFAFGLTA